MKRCTKFCMKSLSYPLLTLLVSAASVSVILPVGCYHHDDDCHDDFHNDHHNHHNDCHLHSSHGGVIIVVADRPLAGIRCLYLTITSLALTSEEIGGLSLFESEKGVRLDLLRLKGPEETQLLDLLLGRSDVPAATYDGVRISVRDPVLVLDSGEIVSGDRIDLVAEGEIQVAIDPALPVGPDDTMFLSLDFDLERSVGEIPNRVHDQRLRLRPIVLVDAYHEEDVVTSMTVPLDVQGWVSRPDFDTQIFDLELDDGRGWLQVISNDETMIFDEDLQQDGFDNLIEGEWVYARGSFNANGQFEPRRIVRAAVRTLRATVENWRDGGPLGLVEEGAVFLSLRPFGDLATAGLIDVYAKPTSLLSLSRRALARPEHLQPGTEVHVTMLAPDKAASDTTDSTPREGVDFETAVTVDVRPRAVTREVLSVARTQEGVELRVIASSGVQSTYPLAPTARAEFGDGSSIAVTALRRGDQLLVHLAPRASRPSPADLQALSLQRQTLRGTITEVLPDRRELKVFARGRLHTVSIPSGATILRVEASDGVLRQSEVRLDAIEPGMWVETASDPGAEIWSRVLIVSDDSALLR